MGLCLGLFFFLVPELTSSFFALSRKNSRYTEKDAAVVVRQMLKVAAECHLRGLVHRDMKPEVWSSSLIYLANLCKMGNVVVY